jgi:AAA+ superfamily predicted ATPase
VTTAQLTEEWVRDNQRHLVLAAEAVAARLDARVDDDAQRAAEAAEALARSIRASTGQPVALDRLTALFGLTPFERDLLIGVAAAEMGLPQATGPVTFSRALVSLSDPHWSALLPDGPLRGWRLFDVPAQLPSVERGGLSGMPLAVDERVLHALLGADTLDPRLAGRARLAEPVCRLPGRHQQVAERLARLISPARGQDGALLTGGDPLTRRQVVVEAAARLGLTVIAVTAGDLPGEPTAADALGRLLARECALGTRALVIETSGDDLDLGLRLLGACAAHGVAVVLSGDEQPGVAEGRQSPRLRLPPTTAAERESLFEAAFGEHGLDPALDARALAAHHSLTPAAIALGVDRAVRVADPGEPPDIASACRELAERPLRGLARLEHPQSRLSDLVLSETTERALHALLANIRQRGRVHGEWGYGSRGRGLAVTALFTGASGTGKTTAAEAVAAELGIDVVRADISQVVSKYIGETEKNLAVLFDAAEAGAVLLFDEGDALFSKRTQVHDSHDRYANLEVSYLLQRLETFTGIAIVTTNARESIDAAFTRRMRFVVSFPFPDAEQRTRLWEQAFPADVPVRGLAPMRLAQLAVSGGTIEQLAMHAAFLAADEQVPVQMTHVLEAARIECDKLERPLAATEIKGWV